MINLIKAGIITSSLVLMAWIFLMTVAILTCASFDKFDNYEGRVAWYGQCYVQIDQEWEAML